MTVRIELKKNQKPTEEQIKEIRKAKTLEPVYDEEAPELTFSQMERYKKAAAERRNTTPITLSLSQRDFEVAKSFGTNYREMLSRLLSLALQDASMIAKMRN